EQHLHVALRLHRAAHHPEAHPWLLGALRVGLGYKRRDERVERTLPRRHRIRETRLEREPRAAILQREPGPRRYDTRPKRIEQRIYKGDRSEERRVGKE